MAESPDFQEVARQIADLFGAPSETEKVTHIASQLRDVWNARGIADQAAIDDTLSTLVGWVTSEPYRVALKETIAKLDQ